MGTKTKIEWTDHTFNPWMGCAKVSPGCDHCYAERDARRWKGKRGTWGPNGKRVIAAESTWKKPLAWNRAAKKAGKRRRVFCGSLVDVFEDRDDLDLARARLWQMIAETPSLDWLLLTKRPRSILPVIQRLTFYAWHPTDARACSLGLPNVWLGVSVENADYLHRIDTLKSCRASVLFLSLEPLLGPLPTLGEYLDGIDWVIAGGESGPGAQPTNPPCFRSVRDECQAAGVPFFFKGWGKWQPLAREHGGPGNWSCDNPQGVKMVGSSSTLVDNELGFGAIMLPVGKKVAGRLLDGRKWNEVPK